MRQMILTVWEEHEALVPEARVRHLGYLYLRHRVVASRYAINKEEGIKANNEFEADEGDKTVAKILGKKTVAVKTA